MPAVTPDAHTSSVTTPPAEVTSPPSNMGPALEVMVVVVVVVEAAHEVRATGTKEVRKGDSGQRRTGEPSQTVVGRPQF